MEIQKTYVPLIEVVNNLTISMSCLIRIINGVALERPQRKRGAVVKILVKDLGLIVRCDLLYQKGYSTRAIIGLGRNKIYEVSSLLNKTFKP